MCSTEIYERILPSMGNTYRGINSSVWTIFIGDLEILNKPYVYNMGL